jgi:hypothetical protein
MPVPVPGISVAVATPTGRRLRISMVSPVPAVPSTVTSTAAPRACLRALVSPSWTIRAGDLVRRRFGTELERSGVEAQERDAVGEHVVHLARDSRPLLLARLLDAELLLGLGALGAVAE